ncbi:3-hydroxyacyl-CoA dehydrogenase family protein [Sinanaerobacter chloroacetimidivorans]|uniref:3-hydroxybutyryl-CoA dehydrogenase n=1 Tax=Sinanaerobacter chloroacetimidivorans TaxID=2818044 RepID=A0A8J7W5R7_9FIRM|nr:3-hydroxyacyl-CoA dehydrogenase family protein [Sinanaerobacter chloroacetimidivorans]MBR0599848.1 3-hydroxyacyl-CoA dehydrogenase family protein [Sinanaerobacter chloroacetimidivorans]
MSIKNVTILGSGLMGNGLALVFAKDEEARVIVRSRNMKNDPLGGIRANLDMLIERDAMTEEEAGGILSRISFTTDLEGALKEADLVVECVLEDMELKQNLFRDIEPLCKASCILATNTSVMSITEIASKVKDKSRFVGTHFWNPPYLIPLVEVVKGEETSDETMDLVYDYLKKIGKKPVKCMKDVPGFIANRLQHAIWREALSIVEKGIADASTVDEALRYGPGLRWPILGILENADMIGLDLSLNIQRYIVKYLEDSHEPSKLLRELVEKGDLGFKTGKGYQTWTPEQTAASNKRLREYLIDVTKDLK